MDVPRWTLPLRSFYAIYATLMISILLSSQREDGTVKLLLSSCAILWVSGLPFVLFGQSRFHQLAYAAPFVQAALLILPSFWRIAFILKYGGMDCGACNGSPMAFLLDWVFELMLLIPAVALCIWMTQARRSQLRG